MSIGLHDPFEEAETDTLLRQMFSELPAPRVPTNLAERAMRLAADPARDATHASALFVRRCASIMNLLGIALIALVLWKGMPLVWAAIEAADSTATSATTTVDSFALTSTLQIACAAILLFVAAGTQWAFRAPAGAPTLLPVGNA